MTPTELAILRTAIQTMKDTAAKLRAELHSVSASYAGGELAGRLEAAAQEGEWQIATAETPQVFSCQGTGGGAMSRRSQ